jgi:hypothetical protein
MKQGPDIPPQPGQKLGAPGVPVGAAEERLVLDAPDDERGMVPVAQDVAANVVAGVLPEPVVLPLVVAGRPAWWG